MSAALINRSLTNVRTELEFLHDSEVIDEKLMNALIHALPQKYQKDMEPWSVDKLETGASADDTLSKQMSQHTIQEKIQPPANPPAAPVPSRKLPAAPIGYCKALYSYEPQEHDDLKLAKDEKVAVVEHLSSDWWMGYKQSESPDKAGVFPSNYVVVISESEFSHSARPAAPPANEKASYEPKSEERASPAAPPYDQVVPQPTYSPYQPQQSPYPPHQQAMQPQHSYGGYAQFPPPPTNYYPQQQPQQQPQAVPQEQALLQSHPHLRKFGSKFGNAAIFGAGATLGGDLVNSIF